MAKRIYRIAVNGEHTTDNCTPKGSGGLGPVLGGIGKGIGRVVGGATRGTSTAAERRALAPLQGGVAHEAVRLASLGVPKNTTVWRPTQADMDSAAFRVIVGEPKFTRSRLP